jgi:hypothetical protein
MTTTLPQTVAAYIQATNHHDPAGFIRCFAENAVVDDAGRQLRGISAIKAWSDHDIFKAQVTLEVLEVADRDGETIVTTKIDGNYDKTGLPDPLVMNHHITLEDDKIKRLTIQFASEKQVT